MRTAVAAIAWLVVSSSLGARSTFAQVATYSDNFQNAAIGSGVPGWVDSAAGGTRVDRVYTVWADPLRADNTVFGFRQMRRRAVAETSNAGTRFGSFSTYTLQSFSAKGGFEFRGRLLRTDRNARIGLTFLSGYPDVDRYYILSLSPDSVRLSAMGGGSPAGAIDSGFAPPPNRWCDFLIQANDVDGATTIRARFWDQGTPEPQTFSINATDAAAGRLTSGRIGIWSAGGDVFVDDLSVRATADRAPAITFFDISSNRALDPSALALFKIAPRIRIESSDDFTASLDGRSYSSESVIDGEGLHSLTVHTSNADMTLRLLVDTRPPVVTLKVDGAPLVDGQTFDHPVTVSAAIADVSEVIVAATLNGSPIALPMTVAEEKGHQVRVTATDQVGWESVVSRSFAIARTAAQLSVISPSANACTNATEVRVSGRVSGASGVKVTLGASSADAMIDAGGAFIATVPAEREGRFDLLVTAGGIVVHVPIIIDRTRPVVEITSGGAPFSGGAFNRALSLFGRAIDADAAASLDMRLNDAPYVVGNAITTDGAYILRASARDCAGNLSDERAVEFVIDKVPPRLATIDPVDGASVGSNRQTVRGTVDIDDLQSAVIDGTAIEAAISGRSFAFADIGLAEGANRLTLLLADRAGNQSRVPYSLAVKSTTPSVAIVENGSPIPAGAIFNRVVTPIIRSSEADAAITATLNGAPFASGSPIASDGDYTLAATAADKAGHTSSASATFAIDRTPPTIHITSPVPDAVVKEDRIEVRVSATGADSVSVNAVPVGSAQAAMIALESGENSITAVASDRAGNVATDSIAVTRDDGRGGIILTIPADNVVTNRPVISVAGQVLTPAAGIRVSLNGRELAVDASGAFRVADFPLVEGVNAISASVISASGKTAVSQASTTAHVIADFTPPHLTVTANAVELNEGDHFPTPPAIALQATDERPGVTTMMTLDGVTSPNALTDLKDGGHTLTAVARDVAGNETRLDRNFVIGSGGSSACVFSGFDPPDGSAIFANSVKLSGHAAGASNVVVNGVRAYVADGSFALHVQLPKEGANSIAFSCLDASGVARTEGQTSITLVRVTGAPSITIDAPARNAIFGSDTIAVSGSVGSDVVSGDVNGVPFTPTAGRYALPKITLAAGANIIVARALNGAGRLGIATTYVVRAGAPLITITSPLAGTETGASSIDVSGTYVNVDPATLSLPGHPLTATTGTFSSAAVPLLPNATTTIAVTGRSGAGVVASASTDVRNIGGSPFISITTPVDNATLPASQGQVDVTGTISPIPGSIVQVNGSQVPFDSSNRFSSTVSLSNGITPIVARVLTPDGKSSSDTVRVSRLAGPLRLKETFPAADARQVDPGVLAVLLFSNPIDGSSSRGAISLVDAAGQAISTTPFVDNDAISIAPDVPLSSGTKYTLDVSTTLKDVAGLSLTQPIALSFVTAAGAPTTPPALDQTDTAGCFHTAVITGKGVVVGARMRLDLDGVSTTVATAADSTFKFDLTFSGQPGYHVARIREVGGDGTLSPEATICYRINCNGPQVLAASLDRRAKRLVIQFSKPMKPMTLVAAPGGTIVLGAFSGVVTINGNGDTATVVYEPDLGISPLSLTIMRSVQDATGIPMAADFAQTFTIESSERAAGKGYVAGAVYDATTGRPLPQAAIVIRPLDDVRSMSDDRGRYVRVVGEGAYILEATAAGFATAWRQAIVRAGAGSVPLDFRLTRRGDDHIAGADLNIDSGGDDATTRHVTLYMPASALLPNRRVALTAIGAQSLPAALPLGWSPIAAAEIAIDAAASPVPISGSRLTFVLTPADANAIAGAAQTLTLAQYESDRNEWRAVAAVAAIGTDGRVIVDVLSSGDYALVYADRAPPLAHPPNPHNGGALQGVVDPCRASADICRPASRSFVLDPSSIPPNGRTVATLMTDGRKPYPSGTAIQATIDEQLNLADGRIVVDPPFTTDLLLYRTLSGDSATAVFHLAPSAQASGATLRDGVDHIRIVDYPGRVDRGALIGAEGGKVSGGEMVSLEIPTGATSDPIHASIAPLTDFGAFGNVAGFQIAGGFTLSLARSGDSAAPVTLLKSARATVTVESSKFATANRQVVIAEVLGQTPFGMVVRLAALTQPSPTIAAANVALFTARQNDLPLDGIVRDGSYLILTANAPIAFAFGQVRLGNNGPAMPGALVMSPGIGLTDLTRIGGVFVIPVAAKPAPPFALRPRSTATGDGALTTFTSSPDPDAVVSFGDLALTVQAPHLMSLSPASGATLDPTAAFLPQAVFDMPIDSASVAANVIVDNLTARTTVPGSADSAGNTVTFRPAEALRPATQYSLTILPTLRGSNGAPFGRNVVSQFATRNVPAGNTTIRPELIHITIPDSAGASIISGRPGALPAGSQAVPVRRGRNFVMQYQGTVAADGSFSFAAGAGVDAIATMDAIDLQVVDAISHAIIAIIPLTPFTTADGSGFLASPNADAHFVTAQGVAVDVPAGAFDLPTIITLSSATPDLFAFASELRYTAGVTVQFDGVAKKRIDLELPIPPNTNPSIPIYLGYLGQSIRGPR
ncbi:MAG: Ig-like domain-containing protein, partial [Acidobacteriota bacterium]|nr:Ig-like domain-containing protein [Acidobacteriota bacterium]